MGLAVLDCKYGIKTDIVKRLRKEQAPNEMVEKLKVNLSDEEKKDNAKESGDQLEKLTTVDNQPNEIKLTNEKINE